MNHLLFDRRNLALPLLDGEGAREQQRRLATHQLLQFAIENDYAGDGDPKRKLLGWIRRLEVFGDERALREPPPVVESINAVRLMTVHASKGLEFRVVHLPGLGKGMFPRKRSGQICPLPDGLLPGSPETDHDEEEECLFFVALSRARDHLSLSRAKHYTKVGVSQPPDALNTIASHLPRSILDPATWRDNNNAPSTESGARSDLAVAAIEHDARDVELYLGCPRRFLYQHILGLSSTREDTGYVQFHRAVYRVLRWMATQGATLDASAMSAEFDAAWNAIGPTDHPLVDLYLDAARKILAQASRRSRDGIEFGAVLQLEIDGHTISVALDELERSPGVTVVRRLRTGRPPQEPDKRIPNALIVAAGRQHFGTGSRFEVRYLSTDEPVSPNMDGVMDARVRTIGDALTGMAQGFFPAAPDDDCPRCPHYFICPSLPK